MGARSSGCDHMVASSVTLRRMGPEGPLIAGSAAHLAMLAFATVISVDKPWGRTPRGRRLAERRATRHVTAGA
ncbi:MAG TPA: hypothetical protein VHF25_00145 [Nitriliruptorales bacterium]|nr:hypothetical protein [Nitriliruptorales bacterium]